MSQKHIVLVVRANGATCSKPMRMPVDDCQRLVNANRAHFISRTVYRYMTGKVPFARVQVEEARRIGKSTV